ncbi:Fic family protein [Candidatus Uhrbacteria bacterium]|nr:Fic family protein [Candidatus Uhrbacteria bacterium]
MSLNLTQYILEKPDLGKIDKKSVISRFTESEETIMKEIDSTMSPQYGHWDKIKYRQPPNGFNREEFWFLIKMIRQIRSSQTFVKDVSGKFYRWVELDRFNRFMHQFDMSAGGDIFVNNDHLATLKKHKDRYISRGQIEEAIASSQLEGAHTTRLVAKKMILEKRPAKTKDERMILNNYGLMERIGSELLEVKLDRKLLLEMQTMLTEGTDTEPDHVGRFRKPEDDLAVANNRHIGHVLPDTEWVNLEMDRLLAIANDEADEVRFLNPVIKAVFLHFWIGYLHPFPDGNGRIARAIFYWYLMKHGYWAIAYLPLSAKIKQSPKQYSMAYIYAEQDDLDLTYFIDYNLSKLQLAIGDFQEYISRKTQEESKLRLALGSNEEINDRQKEVLSYLARNPQEKMTIGQHQARTAVTRATARKDLYSLCDQGYLSVVKQKGHFVNFIPTDKTISLMN